MATLAFPTIVPLEIRRPGILPGIALCLVVTAAAYLTERVEVILFGKAWLEALVLAILLGTMLRTFRAPDERWHAGIAWSAKYLLEIAVVLLGASVSAGTILAAGPGLLVGIAVVVATAIVLSVGIGRTLGLPVRMALLVACGNSICGNSAIAAVAPVIGADGDDVAASIAFTAVLGVGVVLGLPLLGLATGMSAHGFGAFAGLTVYAVPQVIAAAAPLGATAVQMGTLVKLVRVLRIGPLIEISEVVCIGLVDAGVDTVMTFRTKPLFDWSQHGDGALRTNLYDRVAAPAFPCVGAKAALARGTLDVLPARSITSAWDDVRIHDRLMNFAAAYRSDPGLFRSLAVAFEGPDDLDESAFERALWARVQSLSDKDVWRGQAYDRRVSADPDDPHFSLSFGGEAFFVVGLHPAASRPARRFPNPVMVFNLHDQFETLRAQGKYEGMREKIMVRDEALAGSRNPMLVRHGEASEARQYSGREVGADWRCPFSYGGDMARADD